MTASPRYQVILIFSTILGMFEKLPICVMAVRCAWHDITQLNQTRTVNQISFLVWFSWVMFRPGPGHLQMPRPAHKKHGQLNGQFITRNLQIHHNYSWTESSTSTNFLLLGLPLLHLAYEEAGPLLAGLLIDDLFPKPGLRRRSVPHVPLRGFRVGECALEPVTWEKML